MSAIARLGLAWCALLALGQAQCPAPQGNACQGIDQAVTASDVSLVQVGFSLADEKRAWPPKDTLPLNANSSSQESLGFEVIPRPATEQPMTVDIAMMNDATRQQVHRETGEMATTTQIIEQLKKQQTMFVPREEASRLTVFVLFSLILVSLLHELAVLLGWCAPLLSLWAVRKLRPLQAVFSILQLDLFYQAMLILPVSLDLAAQLGKSAASSGLLLSVNLFGCLFGIAAAKVWLGDGSNWRQQLYRRGVTLSHLLTVFLNAATGAFVARSVARGSQSADTIWIVLLLIRMAHGAATGFAFMVGNVMGIRAVPEHERTMFGLANTVCRNYGLMFAPLMSSIAIIFAGSTEAPASDQLLHVMVTGSFFSAVVSLLLATLIPNDLPLTDTCDADDSPNLEMMPEDMPDAQRRAIAFSMAWYTIERAATVTAIEVSSIMIFEVEYGMTSTEAGGFFGLAGGISACVCMAVCFILYKKWVLESSLLKISVLASCVGAVLLFDVGGFATLMLADICVYALSSVANGIGEGWSSRAAKEGTDFSQSVVRGFVAPGVFLSRLVTPPLARWLVDFGGRNTYAVVQCITIAIGAHTVHKTFQIRATCTKDAT